MGREAMAGREVIARIDDRDRRAEIARAILEALPDWFGNEAAREDYIAKSRDWPFFAAFEEDAPVGFLCLKPTGRETVELSVMGVLERCHRRGYGKQLLAAAMALAREQGYEFMQVKTVKMGVYEDYDRTNRFYLSQGFREFEVMPEYWDEKNPCQIYVMAL